MIEESADNISESIDTDMPAPGDMLVDTAPDIQGDNLPDPHPEPQL